MSPEMLAKALRDRKNPMFGERQDLNQVMEWMGFPEDQDQWNAQLNVVSEPIHILTGLIMYHNTLLEILAREVETGEIGWDISDASNDSGPQAEDAKTDMSEMISKDGKFIVTVRPSSDKDLKRDLEVCVSRNGGIHTAVEGYTWEEFEILSECIVCHPRPGEEG